MAGKGDEEQSLSANVDSWPKDSRNITPMARHRSGLRTLVVASTRKLYSQKPRSSTFACFLACLASSSYVESGKIGISNPHLRITQGNSVTRWIMCVSCRSSKSLCHCPCFSQATIEISRISFGHTGFTSSRFYFRLQSQDYMLGYVFTMGLWKPAPESLYQASFLR